MQEFINVLNLIAAPGNTIRTVSSKDVDFPPSVPFQTGGDTADGSDVNTAKSQATRRIINGDCIWQLGHVALFSISTGESRNTELEAVYASATGDGVIGIVLHPADYDPGPDHINGWFDFIATNDPTGENNRTAAQILEGQPCEAPCVGNLDCEDYNACTTDTCDSGICIHTPVAAGNPCGSTIDDGCTDPDTCLADGICSPNDAPNATACIRPNGIPGVCRAGRCAILLGDIAPRRWLRRIRATGCPCNSASRRPFGWALPHFTHRRSHHQSERRE